MAVRILHCGSSVENYELCISERVAGFKNRSPTKGDLIYLAVKINNKSYCGARGVLGDLTDIKPWPDEDLYIHCLAINDLEYSEPFDLSKLAKVGGKYWSLKYLQGAKSFNDKNAETFIDEMFATKKRGKVSDIKRILYGTRRKKHVKEKSPEPESKKSEESSPKEKISIMGTFQTIHFHNESDKFKGLESLVNQNFHALFPQFPQERTLLIPENRMFKTKTAEEHKNVAGIRSIPDGLLLVYNKSFKPAIQMNIIEYECYGERITRPVDKSNFFNGQIIPQLMKFASSFSIVTDRNIRNDTIKDWKSKVMDYIDSNKEFDEKLSSWIKDFDPEVSEKKIGLKISDLIEEAFRNNLRVLLIIDELSSEQKETLNNVINAFKLENGKSIKFRSYVVRLVQQLNMIDNTQEYALTVQ